MTALQADPISRTRALEDLLVAALADLQAANDAAAAAEDTARRAADRHDAAKQQATIAAWKQQTADAEAGIKRAAALRDAEIEVAVFDGTATERALYRAAQRERDEAKGKADLAARNVGAIRAMLEAQTAIVLAVGIGE